MFIYLITNTINGKKYVGQTTRSIEERWKHHCRERNTQLIVRAIKKHGKENFEIKQVARVEGASKEESLEWLNILEPLFIKAYNSLAPNGYNLDSGGKNKMMHADTKKKISGIRKGKPNGRLGKKLSGETKARIGAANSISLIGNVPWNKGKTGLLSEETRFAMGSSFRGKIGPFKGKKHSKKTKQRIRLAKLGTRASKETRNKMSKSHTGSKRAPEARANMSKAQAGRIAMPEARKNMSRAHLGQVPWNKGKSHTEEAISNMRKSQTARRTKEREAALIE